MDSVKNVIHLDPLHVCGNAANLEDKTKEIFASVKKSCSVLQIGCIPTDLQGVYLMLFVQQSFSSLCTRYCGSYTVLSLSRAQV